MKKNWRQLLPHILLQKSLPFLMNFDDLKRPEDKNQTPNPKLTWFHWILKNNFQHLFWGVWREFWQRHQNGELLIMARACICLHTATLLSTTERCGLLAGEVAGDVWKLGAPATNSRVTSQHDMLQCLVETFGFGVDGHNPIVRWQTAEISIRKHVFIRRVAMLVLLECTLQGNKPMKLLKKNDGQYIPSDG